MKRVYPLFFLLSYLIRTFVLSPLVDVGMMGVVVDFLAPLTTYSMVGFVYSRGEQPLVGLLMYFVLFTLNTVFGSLLIHTWFSMLTIAVFVIYFVLIGIYYKFFSGILFNL